MDCRSKRIDFVEKVIVKVTGEQTDAASHAYTFQNLNNSINFLNPCYPAQRRFAFVE